MNRVRLAFCALAFCGLSVAGLARQEQAAPVVTAAAPADKIRFAGSPTSVQLRIEVWSVGGALLYDSDWKAGNILDWLPQDGSGQPLAYGVYRLLMRSKDLGGQTSEKQVSLRVDSGSMAVDDQPGATPRITLTAHDGETGELITTSGDLSFRFGDFLNRKDTEVMRLTKDGNLGIGTDSPKAPLDVNGLIRTNKGIMFSDGTILTTAAGLPTAQQGGATLEPPGLSERGAAPRSRPVNIAGPIGPIAAAPTGNVGHTPKPTATPDYQFKVDSGGVHIGTTNAFGLSVAGNVNLSSNLILPPASPTSGVIMSGAATFVHNYGTGNAFLGVVAGNLTMTGGFNVGVGNAALYNNSSGIYNTGSGYYALFSNNTGNNNTGIGQAALAFNTGGFNNTGIGSYSLYNNTGNSNIGVGYTGGNNLTTGSNNIDIGNAGVAAESNAIRIGISGVQTQTFIAGIASETTSGAAVPVLVAANGQLGTASSSRRYKFDISDMGSSTDDLMRLRPVTFRYLAQGDNAALQYGLIAEEVAGIYPEMVTRNRDGEPEAVMYQFLAPMLLNEVQKEHQKVEEQQKTIDALNTKLDRLMQRVEQLEESAAAAH